MEDSSIDFNAELQTKIEDKLIFINDNILNILSDAVPEFRKSLETVVGALKNAGILNEDRYQSSSEPHELKLPPDDEVAEDAVTDEISFRLSEYLRRLEFLENNYNIAPDALTIERCRELINFYNFINWERLSPASSSANVRMLVGVELAVQKEDDSLLRGIVRDGKKQLSDTRDRILCGLEDIYVYLLESYKLEIRNRVLPSISIAPEAAAIKPDEAVLIIKKEFRNEMGGIPFINGLVRQIVDEDFSANFEAVRLETILRIEHNNTSITSDEADFELDQIEADSGLLFEGFRLLSAAGPSLLQISEKLTRNSDIIENTQLSFFQRLLRFLSGRGTGSPERIYSVIIFNAEDETGSKLKIDLNRFTAELKKEGTMLLALGSKSSTARLELEQGQDLEVLSELEKHLKRVFRFQSVLPAVDQHLKEKASNSMRGSMNGIKLDLNDIQSCIIKANKRRLEYQTQQNISL
ncbi:MAG TPA: hypothetical protein DCO79_01665 [Spirochaeta sp.]|nr:hypothetical protein [Spirochaeta sp.]